MAAGKLRADAVQRTVRGQVRAAQHEPEVRMRDQVVLAVHRVDAPAPADADLAHHVADELEVELGERHRARAARVAHRKGDERHRAFPEECRAVVGAPRAGTPEVARSAEIAPAADHVEPVAGSAQAFATIRRNVAHLGDRGDELHRALVLLAPVGQLQQPAVPRQLAHLHDLAFDAAEVLLDAAGRRAHLRPLHLRGRLHAFPVGEDHLHQSLEHEGAAHQPGEDRRVLAEEAAPDHGLRRLSGGVEIGGTQ